MFGVLVGNLGRDPEVRQGNNGSFTTFSVAVNSYNPETGERDLTTWYSVIMNGRRGETVAKHFHKGDGIILQGRITGLWTGDNGNSSVNFRATDFLFPPRGPEAGGGGLVEETLSEPDDPFGGGGDPFA